jgi:hypothetical protein
MNNLAAHSTALKNGREPVATLIVPILFPEMFPRGTNGKFTAHSVAQLPPKQIPPQQSVVSGEPFAANNTRYRHLPIPSHRPVHSSHIVLVVDVPKPGKERIVRQFVIANPAKLSLYRWTQ